MIGYLNYSSDWGNRAKVVFSTPVSKTTPPGASGFAIQYNVGGKFEYVGDYLQDKWATVKAGSSPSLYSDSTIDNVFAITPLAVSSETEGLYYYPNADGSPDGVFSVFSDFRVMEDFICKTIGSYRGFDCGSVDVMD